LSDARPPNWPRGVEPIGIEDLNRVGIDPQHRLYWDGHPVEVRSSLALTRFQKWFAVGAAIIGLLAGLATIATGLNNASLFLCARHITVLTCPTP
jgi:hypothetical protein